EPDRRVPTEGQHPWRIDRIRPALALPGETLERGSLAAGVEDRLGQLAATDLNPVADVVDRARLTLPQDARDPRHLVIDVQVVARRRAVARDEDCLPAQRARDQARNELVDRLARAIGGGRARNQNG